MSDNIKNKPVIVSLIPILFGFFVMGYCDLIGVSVTYVKEQFQWSETQAGFLPSVVFFWFLALSVPVAMLMNKIGRKNTVLVSIIVTFFGMIFPLLGFTPLICYLLFALLGIGNTILQVSLNPLLSNVVQGKMLTSSLTAGQFIKAISAFLGPLLAGYFSLKLGRWEIIFSLYAVIALISAIWLYFAPIEREVTPQEPSSIRSTFSLLNDKKIVWLFLGIVTIVGLDVGMSIAVPKLLMERIGLTKEAAGYGNSWYFAAKTSGAFLGAFFLAKMSEVKYFRVNIILALLALSGLFFMHTKYSILLPVVVIAFAVPGIFSVLFSMALRTKPDKANEISGLMITGVSGGAVIPPLMGICTDLVKSQNGSLFIICICALYLGLCAFRITSENRS